MRPVDLNSNMICLKQQWPKATPYRRASLACQRHEQGVERLLAMALFECPTR